jgi:hypothetical protein
MSVLLETSLGDIVIDLEVEACPKTCENFLKLCKVYYYNLHAFFNGKSINLYIQTRLITLFQCRKTFLHKQVIPQPQERVASQYGRL